MKKLALAGLVIIVFIAYVVHQNLDGNEGGHVAAPQTSQNTSSTRSNSSNSVSYKDGTYTGNSTDAFYGNIQVQATISGGKITDVQFLQYPNDQRTSQEINGQAMPALKQEAIAAQSANVQIVSGATQSSQAFQQSLQSALDQAKA